VFNHHHSPFSIDIFLFVFLFFCTAKFFVQAFKRISIAKGKEQAIQFAIPVHEL